jgi:hypothetical protein
MQYYSPEVNWSVRKINSSWCLVCRQEDDIEAETEEQLEAIEMWKRACEDSYDRAAGIA